MFSKEIEVEYHYGSESIEKLIKFIIVLKITEYEREMRDFYISSKNIETLMEERRN